MLEVKGKTVEEAIQNGLREMELTRGQVDVTVFDEGSKGFLGFGVKPARVLLTEKPKRLQQLQEKMEARQTLRQQENAAPAVMKKAPAAQPSAPKPAAPAVQNPAPRPAVSAGQTPAPRPVASAVQTPATKPAAPRPAAQTAAPRPAPVRPVKPAGAPSGQTVSAAASAWPQPKPVADKKMERPAAPVQRPQEQDAQTENPANSAPSADVENTALRTRPERREPRRTEPRERRAPREPRPISGEAAAPAPQAADAPKPRRERRERPVRPVTPRPAPTGEPTALSENAKTYVDEIIARMGLSAQSEAFENADGVFMNLSGEDVGTLIGYRGETLDALQYLVSLHINRGEEAYHRVLLDAENYRGKREETLVRLAHHLANKAVKSGRKVSLEPMNPYERRILHSALQDDNRVRTHSEGDEPYRRVVITPKKGGAA